MNDTTEFDKAGTVAHKKANKNASEASTSDVTQSEANAMLEIEKKQKHLLDVYKNQEKHAVRIAPSYAKYFGKLMRVSINGISVTIPCDGQSYSLPLTFATEVERRMAAMDRYESKTAKMANIKSNFESSPGQLTF